MSAASRAQFIADEYAMFRELQGRLASIERAITGFMPQDQPTSIQRFPPEVWDGTTSTVGARVTTNILAATGRPVAFTYTPTNNAWWDLYGELTLLCPEVADNSFFETYWGLSPVDVDGMGIYGIHLARNLGLGGYTTGTPATMFKLAAGVTYTATMTGFNSHASASWSYQRIATNNMARAIAYPRSNQ